MSEAEPEVEETEAEDDAAPEEDSEPSFSEKVEQLIESVDEDELRDIEEPDDVEREAIKRIDIRAEYTAELDELDDTESTHDELDRLYNDEGLSLMDIGRLYRSTDATIQRRMEQHGLDRRGNRAELTEEELVDEMQRLAVEINDNVSDFEEYQELAAEGKVDSPTTTAMTDVGNHSAHTYYNYWDSWDQAVEGAGATVADVEDDEDEAEEAEADAEDEGSDDE